MPGRRFGETPSDVMLTAARLYHGEFVCHA